jgi:TPR repeat protein
MKGLALFFTVEPKNLPGPFIEVGQRTPPHFGKALMRKIRTLFLGSLLLVVGYYTIEWTRMAAEYSHQDIIFYEATHKKFDARAKSGDAEAQFQLGRKLIGRFINHKYRTEGIAWVGKAAQAGHPRAMETYGSSFLYGWENTKADTATALYWFSKAAATGNTDAMLSLAEYYSSGVFAELNLEKTQYWIDEAVRHGMLEDWDWSTEILGRVFLQAPKGQPLDINKAIYWFKRLLKTRKYSGAARLGEIYMRGIGVPADPVKALHYYHQGHEPGVHFIPMELVKHYFSESQERNPKHGYDDFIKAEGFRTGSSGSIDLKQAYAYYLKAVKQGSSKAALAIARMFDGKEIAEGTDGMNAIAWLFITHEMVDFRRWDRGLKNRLALLRDLPWKNALHFYLTLTTPFTDAEKDNAADRVMAFMSRMILADAGKK